MVMIKNLLSPSILAIDFGRMNEQLEEVYAAGARMIHFDVMDGDFVPNISFGVPVLRYVRKALPDAFIDVHMMVREPVRYLDAFKKAGANGFTIHYEACSDLKGDLAKIREAGLKVGVSIKPATPVNVLEDIAEDIDMALIMSVEPGFGGQSFIPATFERTRWLRDMFEKKGLEKDIQVDGGVVLGNLQDVLDAGTNVIVAGSAIFGGDPTQNVKDFLDIMGNDQSITDIKRNNQ